jgi:RNA polymerase sigma-70 factor (ECF subfamily)
LPTIVRNEFRSNDSATLTDSGAVGVLVRSAQRGDMKAFERLYRLHSGRVMGLCLRMIRERDAAEDCVQQTFINAWRNLDRFEARSAFSTWLHGIAVNVVLSHKRSSKAAFFVDIDAASNDDLDRTDPVTEDSRAFDTGDAMDLEQALATLPDGAKFVVVLRGIYGYSHEEVADMLGIAVGTCKAQLHRARRMLRNKLDLPGSHHAV